MRITKAILAGAWYTAFTGAAGAFSFLLYGHEIGTIWLASTAVVAVAVGAYSVWDELRPPSEHFRH